jgi:hypothetical protein
MDPLLVFHVKEVEDHNVGTVCSSYSIAAYNTPTEGKAIGNTQDKSVRN